ncbi:MAG: glycosyltransferase [Chloroflexi bacterium HGW-Chloroflexi-10]|nr:MAG: glycosyltransferase [Chloroflexi bacterium HGW-Chloroflexi-10]
MKISIITPSYNQKNFIERTIVSVIKQSYSDIEYILVDGCSYDGTNEIISKYSTYFSNVIIESDCGQAQAINKGLRLATGEIIGWINSDDLFLPDTLEKIVRNFILHPEIDFVYGKANFIDENDNILGCYPTFQLPKGKAKYKFWKGWPIPQPTVFFRRVLFEKYGYLDEGLTYAMDFEYYLRLSNSANIGYIPELLAYYRIHKKSKTSNWEVSKPLFYNECIKIIKKYVPPTNISNFPIWSSWYLYLIKEKIKSILLINE